jgi:di/tricarboxylate transporter
MTLQQGLAFGILGAMMGLFVWGRLRYDLVAALSLLAAVVAGIVPAKEPPSPARAPSTPRCAWPRRWCARRGHR